MSIHVGNVRNDPFHGFSSLQRPTMVNNDNSNNTNGSSSFCSPLWHQFYQQHQQQPTAAYPVPLGSYEHQSRNNGGNFLLPITPQLASTNANHNASSFLQQFHSDKIYQVPVSNFQDSRDFLNSLNAQNYSIPSYPYHQQPLCEGQKPVLGDNEVF